LKIEEDATIKMMGARSFIIEFFSQTEEVKKNKKI